MKKCILLFVIILNLGVLSCTPENVANTSHESCCGDDGSIPPPK